MKSDISKNDFGYSPSYRQLKMNTTDQKRKDQAVRYII
jgi:hypothetical protein